MKSATQVLVAVSVLYGALAQDDGTTANSAGGGGIVTIPTQTGCPTVTATRELCTTCPVPACLGLATVTQSCGCPAAIPTVFLDFPCSDGCKGISCSTSYDIVTAPGTCGTYTPTEPPPTYTPTPTPSTHKPTYPPGETPKYPTGTHTGYPTETPPPGTGVPTPPPTQTRPPPVTNAAPRMGPFAMFRFW